MFVCMCCVIRFEKCLIELIKKDKIKTGNGENKNDFKNKALNEIVFFFLYMNNLSILLYSLMEFILQSNIK